MTRRNKKKKKMQGFIFPVPFAGVIILVSVLGLGYVWLGCQCETLGREIKALESESITLDKKYMNEQSRWAKLKAPHNIEKALIKHNLTMTWPRRDQVVRLTDTPYSRFVVSSSGRPVSSVSLHRTAQTGRLVGHMVEEIGQPSSRRPTPPAYRRTSTLSSIRIGVQSASTSTSG